MSWPPFHIRTDNDFTLFNTVILMNLICFFIFRDDQTTRNIVIQVNNVVQMKVTQFLRKKK